MPGGKGSEATTATMFLVWKKDKGSSGISPLKLKKRLAEELFVTIDASDLSSGS